MAWVLAVLASVSVAMQAASSGAAFTVMTEVRILFVPIDAYGTEKSSFLKVSAKSGIL